MPTDISGRGWARTGLVLGGLVSIAANVAHSFIPPVVRSDFVEKASFTVIGTPCSGPS